MGPALSADLLGFAIFGFATAATPGPNNAMLAASGANFGIRRTIPHMLGIAAGFPVMLLLVAFGFGEILRQAPGLHAILRWAGALYLLWLAWRIAVSVPEGPGQTRSRPLNLLQAALFQWVNPKAWIVAIGAVTTYTTAGDTMRQAPALAAIVVLVTLPCLIAWAALGAGAGRLLSPARLRTFNRIMAALLVLSLAPMLFE